MVRNIAFYLPLFLASGLSFRGWAQLSHSISCLPDVTSLQTFETWSIDQPLEKIYELKTQKFDRIKNTQVLVSATHNLDKKSLELVFSFSKPDVMSLPFNIYAIMVSTSRGEVIWRDLTSSCMEPGIGFFPGQKIPLEPIPLELNEGDSYRLMIWGRI